MNTSGFIRVIPSVLVAAVLVAMPALAQPSGSAVECVDGKFGDHIEDGHVVGDAGSVFAARKAVYWVDVRNPGEPTEVTLVWTIDGKEIQRQSLEVGRSPHWHTWGMRPFGGGGTVEVEVLDASGASLRKDSIRRVP
jgi:hypothetical protein